MYMSWSAFLGVLAVIVLSVVVVWALDRQRGGGLK
jgi:hypothetical protein